MTRSTEGISRPREATSVAIKIALSPALNLFSESSLICYDILPWIFTALKLRNFSVNTSFKLWLQVDVKMIVFLPAIYVSRNTR